MSNIQKSQTLVFRSPLNKSPQRYDLNESQISGKQPSYAPGRESVNARKQIMLQHSNTLALGAKARQVIASGATNFQPKSSRITVNNPREFNPKKYVSKDLKESDVIQLKEVFDYYDSENAGMLSPNDLKFLLSQNGFPPTKETLYEIFSELDEEELGGITFEYFLKIVNPNKVLKEKKDTIRRVYRKYDKQNKGFITLEDLRQVVKDFQEEIDEDQLAEIFKRTDSNQDGKLTFDDFYNVMVKKVYY
ncbi:hypothetical protein pb186bvf_010657 [Paramecium bursaria]